MRTNVIVTDEPTLQGILTAYYKRVWKGKADLFTSAREAGALTLDEGVEALKDLDVLWAKVIEKHRPTYIEEADLSFNWAGLPAQIARAKADLEKCSLHALREAWGLQIG